MATDCPRCGLLNPPSAQRCDCGYDLVRSPTLSGSRITVRDLLLSFDGRIGRYKWWLFFLPVSILSVALRLLDGALGTVDSRGLFGVFSGLFQLLVLYPSLAVHVKRCHDRDRSGWFVLILLIPVIQLWLLVELGIYPTKVGRNRFGLPEPSA